MYLIETRRKEINKKDAFNTFLRDVAMLHKNILIFFVYILLIIFEKYIINI